MRPIYIFLWLIMAFVAPVVGYTQSVIDAVPNFGETPSDTTVMDTVACDSFMWRGSTYTESNTYYDTVSYDNGDTTVFTLHLIVNPSYNLNEADTICQNDFPYLWRDTTFLPGTRSGTFTFHKRSVNGCDSVVTLNLTINPTYFFETDAAICAGDTFSWQRNSYMTEGVYWDSLQTAAGCDSIYKLHLTVNPLPVVTIIATADTVCGGEVVLMANGNTNYSYQWSNDSSNSWISVDSTGSYSVTATDPNECSNTVSKAITVNQPCHTMIDTTICQGESFDFFGESKTSTGVYVNTATATNGCDSIVTLVLAVNPAYYITRTVTICEGESHLFNGELLTQGGTYYDSLVTVNGCDSIIELKLTVNPLPKINVVADPDSIVCEGGSITLIAEVEKTGTYLWNTGETERKITGINSTGTYTVTFTETATGCENTASKKVIVNPVTYGDTTAVECESFTWYGIEYSSTPEIAPTHTFKNHNDCDSVVTLHLTINDSHDTTLRATICEGDSYNFFGQSIDYSVGTDTLTHTLYTSKGCDSVITLILTVNPLPDVTITTDSAVVCAGAQTTLVATDGMQYHYQWSTSPGDTNVSVSVGVGNYTVTVTDDKSCSNTASFQVTERAQFSSGSIVSGDTAVCFGSAVSVLIGNSTSAAGGDGLISYRWKCNNVEISNSNSSTISVDVSTLSVGTFSYTREAKDNTCNTGWTASGGQYKITVHQKQTLSLISGDSTQTICYGNSISPVYYRFGGGALSASVSGLPAGVSATLAHDTLYLSGTPSQIGTSSYTVNTVSGNVCEMATRSGTITVLGLPNVTISGDSVFCQGNSITLTASPNSATSYAWSNGQSGNAITVNTSGNYTVTVTDGNHCSASASKTVTVNPLPTVTIAGESSFCQGDHVTLTATGAISYKWSDNSTAASITVSSEGAYSVTGTGANGCANTATKTITVNSNYNITVHDTICDGKSYNFFGQNIDYSVGTNTFTDTLYTSKGCDSIITLILTVNPLPTVTIGGDSSFCQGTSTVLRALGESTYTYLWGTDEVSDSIIVSSAGTYTLTATNQYRCTASTTKSVTVDTLPEITITGVTSFCYGSSTDLTASGANTYIWNTGSGANSITVSDGGIYSVTGTNDNGCRGTASVMTFVKPLPVPQIVGPSAICQGDTATLTVYGGNTYVWSNNSTQNSINVTQGGTYTVTATSAEQCSATTSFALTVNPLPTITIIGDISFCQDTNTTLTASGASTYVWSNGASGSTITVNTAGAYTVTGTDNNGCTASADKVVTVDTLPVITITGVTSFCYGSSTGLTASGAGTYIWSTGSGTNSITVMDGGMYSVTGTNGNGCRGTASVMTFVKPLPVPQIVGPSEICQGDVATLTAYGGNTYLWSNGSVQNSINVTQSNTYTVTATSSEGCSAIDAFTLTVHSLPNVTIAGESSFCQGSSTILTAGGASTYVWSNGATGSTITVNTAGTYTVTGTDGNGCKNTAPHQLVMNPTYSTSLSDSICQGENYNFFGQNLTESGIYTHTLSSVAGCDSVIILSLTVTPLPIPLITGDNTFCPDEVATLVAGGGTDYLWSTGETTNQIQVETPDTYTVTVTDAYGCSADASFTVAYAPNSLDRLSIVAKRHADGTPYMLVYPQAGLRYQWYKGGDPIPGATQQYYAPDGGLLPNTSYKVHVAPMDPDSCGLFSDEWTYSGTASTKVRILPNPNNGRFRLLLPEGTVDVQILNANGQLVLSRKTDGATELEMDTGLANGLYFVKTYRQDGSFNTEKLIINR